MPTQKFNVLRALEIHNYPDKYSNSDISSAATEHSAVLRSQHDQCTAQEVCPLLIDADECGKFR